MSSTQPDTVKVDLGGRVVTVPKGGLYDRYRMDTDLDEVARDPRVAGVEFFRALSKTKVDSAIGPTRTPNFYYRIATEAQTIAVERLLPVGAPTWLSPSLYARIATTAIRVLRHIPTVK